MNPSAVNDKIAPDLEDLAAYLDDMLPGDRRAAVEARLAEDPEYYEIFLDTVRFREVEGLEAQSHEAERGVAGPDDVGEAPESRERRGAKDPVYKVVNARRFRYRYVAAPLLAAASLILALVWRPWEQSLQSQQDSTFFAEANVEALELLEMHPRGWTVWRSGNVPDGKEEEIAFRLGAYQVHLELAIGARDQGAALQALTNLDRELGRLPQVLVRESAQLNHLETTIGQGAVVWDEVASDSQDFQKSLDSVFSKASGQREAEDWGRWSEQVLLLYLGGHQDVLEGHLESPPPGFDDLESISRALQGMRDAPKSPAPSPDTDKTPFLEAHEALEDVLGG